MNLYPKITTTFIIALCPIVIFSKAGEASISIAKSHYVENDIPSVLTDNNVSIDNRPKFRIGFDSPLGLHRQLLLTVDVNTTYGLDFGYDARSIDNFPDDMYWVLENDEYIVQGIPAIEDDTALALGFKTRDGGAITIGIDELENVADDINVLLKDNLTGEIFDLRISSFTTTVESGEFLDRFELVFFNPSLSTEDAALHQDIDLHYIKSQQLIKISNEKSEKVEDITIYNIFGQEVRHLQPTKNHTEYHVSGLSKGTYVVRTSNAKGSITKKFIAE